MDIQQIRNATMKINYKGRLILTDPVFCDRHCMEPFNNKERNPIVDLPFDIDKVIKDIDMVLVSHYHKDHFDDKASDRISKKIPIFCQPGDETKFEDNGFLFVTPVKDKVVWNDITITRTSGHHGTGKWRNILGEVSGFVLKSENEPVVYWTGDTVLCDEVEKTINANSPDIVITHSGGAMIEDSGPIIMDAQQTIDTCKIAFNSILVAVHLEAFDLTTVSRKDLRECAKKNKIANDRLRIPFDGEILSFK